MFNRFCIGALLLVGLTLTFTSCNATSGLDSITISPSTVTVTLMPPGTQQGHGQFTAIGYYGHAGHQTTMDITDQVTWSSSLTQVATINSSGLATATGFNPATGEEWTGFTNITASAQGFNGIIVSNSATFTVTACAACVDTDVSSVLVIPASQTVATVGVPVQFVAIGLTINGASVPLTNAAGINWTSSVPSIASINAATGLATTAGSGTTTITATFTNPDGSGAAGTATLTVAPSGSPEPLVSLAIVPASQTLTAAGQTAGFIAIGTTSTGATVNLTNQTATIGTATIQAASWKSSVLSVATINSATGVATSVNSGTTAITAVASNPDGTVVTGTATLTVNITSSVEPLVSLAIVPGSQMLTAAGQTANMIVIGTTSSGTTVNLTNQTATIGTATIQTATWSSSVHSVATIGTATGIATAVANGTTAITAIAKNPDGTVVTGVATLTVSIPGSPEPLASLAIVPGSQTLTSANQTAGFIAIGTTTTGTTVNLTNTTATIGTATIQPAIWSSSVPSVASINAATGVVTAHVNGVTAITAMATNPDGTVVTGTATLTVNITSSIEPLVSLAIVPSSQTSLTTGSGANVNFIAIGTTSSGTTVNLTNQSATIGSAIIPAATWSSSNPVVATIDAATGVATPRGVGATAIVAVATNPDHTVVTASAAYTVTTPSVTEPYVSVAIVPASQTITTAGQTVQFIAIGTTGTGTTVNLTSAANVVWSSSSNAIASPTPGIPGQFTAVANGVAAVTVVVPNPGIGSNPPDGSVVSASAALTVAIPSTPEKLISLSILPSSQSVAGAPQTTQFLAIGDFSTTYSNPGQQNMANPPMSSDYTVSWYSSNPSVAVVCNSVASGITNPASCPTPTVPGLVIATGQGTTAITAVATNNTDHSGTTAAAVFTVTGPAASSITGLSIIPGSQSINMPQIGQPNPTVNFVVIGTNGVGLQTNVTSQVSWVSSNPAVATFCYPPPVSTPNPSICPSTVTSVITVGVGPGASTITATYTNVGSPATLVTAQATLTVTGPAAEPLLSLAIVPGTPSVQFPTQNTQLTAIGTFSAAPVTQNLTSSVTWSSSNTSIAIVCNAVATPSVPVLCPSAPGLVTAVGQGTTAITAMATNTDGTLVYTTVPFTVVAGSAQQMNALTIIPGSLTLSATGQPGYLVALGTSTVTGLQEDVTSSPQLAWSSSNPAIATVSSALAPTQTCIVNATPPPAQICTNDPDGLVKGVSVGSTNITAEWTNPASGSTPSSVVTAQASIDVTSTPAAEPLLSIVALPSSITDLNLDGTAQYLAYGTFSSAPTLLDITNGFFHAGFPNPGCTATYAAANAAAVAADTAANLPVTNLPYAQCTFVPVTWISTAPYDFPVNSAGTAGATGGLSTAYASGNTNIYAVASNPDSTLVYSSLVTFNCPYAAPTYATITTTVNGVTTTTYDFSDMLSPGTCNTFTIADSLLTTLTVFNAGVNTTGWLITASSATGTPDVIHCGGSVEQATLEGSVCEATYPNGTPVILTATSIPAINPVPAVKFGGWSSSCVPCTLSGATCTPIAAPPFYSETGPNWCMVQVGGGCTLSSYTGTYTCSDESNISVGAIFN